MVPDKDMQIAELSDADLVSESVQGNREAFGQIVQRYQTLVTSVAYSATGNVSQSEDLAQETFVSAWRKLGELREPAKLRPWLCAIVRFLISKEFRRQGREPVDQAESLDTLEEWTSPEPLPPSQAMGEEELALLWRALERVPPIYREPLVLYYREHQSIQAVAEGLGLSEDTVKQRLSRGRKFLQEQFMAFVAGALDQSRPGKTFAVAVIAALPMLGATAKGATVGTTLVKHGSVAATSTTSGGVLQALSWIFSGVVGWAAGALSLGGYVGYKMGSDQQNGARSSRSVASFWRIMGISILLFFGLTVLFGFLLTGLANEPSEKRAALISFYFETCVPVFVFGPLPVALILWIWQRRRKAAAENDIDGKICARGRKWGMVWVMLAMTAAIVYLGGTCWVYTRISPTHFPKTQSLSAREIQNVLANPQIRKFRFRLYQNGNGVRSLSGDLLENGKVTPFVAPVDGKTLALLGEKGIGYETTIEHRPVHGNLLGWWAQRLMPPFCCFILLAGGVMIFRGSYRKESRHTGPTPRPEVENERRVDRTFAALAACGLVALAVVRGINTDWNVRSIPAKQVPAVAALHKQARFEVFEYADGSRKLWISDLHTPEFIAPVDETTLAELASRGITYQTYVAGVAGFPGPSRLGSALWILVFTTGAVGLFWWAATRSALTHHSLRRSGVT